jgi:signal transduction histidine kinase
MVVSTPQSQEFGQTEKLAFLEGVFETIDQGFVVWDDNNCLVSCNQRYRDIWKYPDDLATPGTPVHKLLAYAIEQDGGFGKPGDTQFDDEIERRFNHIYNAHQELTGERSIRSGGREILLRRYSAPGVGNIATFTELSSTGSDEEQLARKSEHLQSTLDAMDQGVAIFSSIRTDELEMCNRRFLEVWGYPPELGKPGTNAIEFLMFDAERGELGPGDPRELAQAYLKRAREIYKQETDDFHTTVDGRTLYIRRRYVEGFAAVSTFTDVSVLKHTEEELLRSEARLQDQIVQLQQREAELEQQKRDLEVLSGNLDKARSESDRLNSEKDRLFSIIAHDLLGPFNAMLGFSELLQKQASTMAPEKIERAATAINDSANGLHQLLTGLLEWSRAQMESAAMKPEDFRLDALIAEIRGLFAATADAKDIRIDSDLAPVTVCSDRQMAATIIRNLLSNAVKFTPGQGTVTLKLASDGDQALFTVADTGVGISTDLRRDMLDGVEVASGKGTAGEPGTGLGFQLCLDFADRLGGKITIESEEGIGSCFQLILPVEGHQQG